MGRSRTNLAPSMDAQQVSAWISDARFSSFLAAAGGDFDRAVQLYVWHAQLSAACFETMHYFEVLLRNVIDARLGRSQPDTPISATWLYDSTVLTDKGLEQVDDAVERLRRAGSPITRGRVVAALSFGFWRALFGGAYEQLWRRELSRAFPGAGKRRKISDSLERLNQFRNRLAHHDSILAVDIAARFIDMVQIAHWADPAAGVWLRDSSRILPLLKARP